MLSGLERLSIFKRALVRHSVCHYSVYDDGRGGRGIMMSSAESYTEEVPVNPILNFLGLLRFDKNYEKLKGTHRVEFDSPEAEVCYNRIIK